MEFTICPPFRSCHPVMFGLGHESKVFYPVICSHTVNVMNDFFWKEKPFQMLLHNEPVLQHIAFGVTKRMEWGEHSNVPIPIFDFSFVKKMIFPGHAFGSPLARTVLRAKNLIVGFIIKKCIVTEWAHFHNLVGISPSVGKITLLTAKSRSTSFFPQSFCAKWPTAFFTDEGQAIGTEFRSRIIGLKQLSTLTAWFFSVRHIFSLFLRFLPIYANLKYLSNIKREYFELAMENIEFEERTKGQQLNMFPPPAQGDVTWAGNY